MVTQIGTVTASPPIAESHWNRNKRPAAGTSPVLANAGFRNNTQALRHSNRVTTVERRQAIDPSKFKETTVASQSASDLRTETPLSEPKPTTPTDTISEQALRQGREALRPTHHAVSPVHIENLQALKQTLVNTPSHPDQRTRHNLATALAQWQTDSRTSISPALIDALSDLRRALEHPVSKSRRDNQITQPLQHSLRLLQQQLDNAYDIASHNFAAAREHSRQTAQRVNQQILQENQLRWREQAFERLVETTSTRTYSPSKTSAKNAVLEGALKQNFIKYGAGKVESNWLRLVSGIARNGDEIFREPISFDTDINASRLAFAGIEHSVGVIQGLLKAKEAYHSIKATEKAQSAFQTAMQDLETATEQLQQLSQTLTKKQTYLNTVNGLEALTDHLQRGERNAIDHLITPLTTYVLSTEGEQALEHYRSLIAAASTDTQSLQQSKATLLAAITSSLQQLPSTKEQVQTTITATQSAIDTHKAQADNAYQRLLELVAGYGQNAQLARALKAEYEEKMAVSLLKALRYGNSLASDALSTARLVVGLHAPQSVVTAARPALGIAGGAVGGVASVFALGLSAYELVKDGVGAYQNHQTKQKAAFLQRHFAEVLPETGRPRDAELADIARTLKHKQSQFRNTKIGHAILNSAQAAGYAAGAVAAGAGIAATITGGGAATAVSAVAGPVGWALAGLGALSLVAYASFRLIKWGIHHYQSKQLQKVVAGDEKALSNYQHKHHLLNSRKAEVQQHAIDALTQHSGKFALHRLQQRLKLEVQNLDRTYWDQAPTISFLNAFFKDNAQVEALAKIDDKQAAKLMAKKFQIKT